MMGEIKDLGLDNCASEPIHIPGAIQPHGALIAFQDGRASWFSANLSRLTGLDAQLGCSIATLTGPACWLAQLNPDFDDVAEGEPVTDLVVDPAGVEWSRAVHRFDGQVLIEFERSLSSVRDPYATSRLFNKIKVQKDIPTLLQICCDEIRAWTGFDRVLGYVFQPDLSGDVVAQSKSDRADSFLGMRFPGSDIPAQARALYVRNTLRFISDVGYAPVALVGHAAAAPLDLSGAALRSVSPIHIEYLKNMGVGASMSVSIVLNGELWGMFACHHNEALQVPLAVRESCDMVASFVTSRLQALLAEELAARHRDAASLTSRLGAEFAQADDPILYLLRSEQEFRRVLRADGLILTHRGKMVATGDVPHDLAVRIAQHFAQPDHLGHPVTRRDEWPATLQEGLGAWVGMLPIDFDPAAGGRMLVMRKEQLATVRWAGEPTKVYGQGPNGPRLSPRGSFSEWQEQVSGVARPWLGVTLEIANTIRTELSRAVAAMHLDAEEARRHLLAILGHDLRDPLHAIRLSATLLQRDEGSRKLGDRIDRSSGRMQRLIAQVLDFSRAEAGLPLVGQDADADICAIVRDLVEESRFSHPGVDFQVETPASLSCRTDSSRLSQAMGNLLSNARHHAAVGTTVNVTLEQQGSQLRFAVSNVASPIPADLLATLFDPLKRIGRAATNRSGLGLGLYITKRIATAMGGDVTYAYRDGRVEFVLAIAAIVTAEGGQAGPGSF